MANWDKCTGETEFFYCNKCHELTPKSQYNEQADACIHCAPCRCEDEEER